MKKLTNYQKLMNKIFDEVLAKMDEGFSLDEAVYEVELANGYRTFSEQKALEQVYVNIKEELDSCDDETPEEEPEEEVEEECTEKPVQEKCQCKQEPAQEEHKCQCHTDKPQGQCKEEHKCQCKEPKSPDFDFFNEIKKMFGAMDNKQNDIKMKILQDKDNCKEFRIDSPSSHYYYKTEYKVY